MIAEDRLKAIVHQSGRFVMRFLSFLSIPLDAFLEFLNNVPGDGEEQRIKLICEAVAACEEYILSREPQPAE